MKNNQNTVQRMMVGAKMKSFLIEQICSLQEYKTQVNIVYNKNKLLIFFIIN